MQHTPFDLYPPSLSSSSLLLYPRLHLPYSLHPQVRRYLVPDNNDDIRKEQIREMELISDPQAAGAGATAPEGGAAGAAAGDRPPPALTPPGECVC